jgi:hypothetical protein
MSGDQARTDREDQYGAAASRTRQSNRTAQETRQAAAVNNAPSADRPQGQRRAQGSPTAPPAARADQPRSRRWHRGPKGATVIDLIFKIDSSDGWSATLRNDPSVVLVADNGDELAQLTRELALAMLQGRRAETLRDMRLAGAVLPPPDSETEDPGTTQDEPRLPDRNAADGRPVDQAS